MYRTPIIGTEEKNHLAHRNQNTEDIKEKILLKITREKQNKL